MQYGVHFHNYGEYADVGLLTDLAGEAEVAGWDGVFVCDHLTVQGARGPEPIADPWIALTAIAQATSRVRIGPMVAALPRRRPWQLASETVTLDRLSGGRLILGVGSGTELQRSFFPFGEELDLKTRAAMLDESLTVLTGLWRGEPFSFDGTHYHVHDATFLPRPVQMPRIPIWVAGLWPHRKPFRRAARWDGFFADVEGVDWENGQIMTADDLRAIVDYTLRHRTSDTPFEAVIGGHLSGDPSSGAARLAPYVAAGLTWWIEGIHPRYGSLAEQWAKLRRGPPRT